MSIATNALNLILESDGQYESDWLEMLDAVEKNINE